MSSKINEVKRETFIDNPAELLSFYICDALKALPVWVKVFGDRIDPYRRMDYSIRELPALRVYNPSYTKQYDSWFVDGDIVMDIILPAEVRRELTQRMPDILSSALMQQFRSQKFFNELEKLIPGLNELGKRFDVDKALAFEWGENIVPLTQVRANFRIDLRMWDIHLEETCRTKDEPFEVTLGELQKLNWNIQGVDEQEQVQVELKSEQKI